MKPITVTADIAQWVNLLAALEYARNRTEHSWTKEELRKLAETFRCSVMQSLEDDATAELVKGVMADVDKIMKGETE